MTQRKLKLLKYKNGRTKQRRGMSAKAPALTPDEAAEAARFKAMTAARAARQAMIRRIMAEVAALDESLPAA